VTPCPEPTARLQAYEASYDGTGTLLTLAADFEVHCTSTAVPYIAGAIRYGATRATLRPFDGVYPVYTINIQAAPNGSVTAIGLDCGPGHNDCSETYASPTTVALLAKPSPGYRFVGG